MKEVVQTNQFRCDAKKMAKRGKDLDKLLEIIRKLALDVKLDPKNRDHELTGNWRGTRDYHIEADWLLLYMSDNEPIKICSNALFRIT